jgi:hypothetical protein
VVTVRLTVLTEDPALIGESGLNEQPPKGTLLDASQVKLTASAKVEAPRGEKVSAYCALLPDFMVCGPEVPIEKSLPDPDADVKVTDVECVICAGSVPCATMLNA